MNVPVALSVLPDVLSRRAAERPEAVALRFDGASLTYSMLAASCEQLAARLWHDLGVREGDRIAWLGANHPGQVMLLFALARVGGIFVPLNFRLASGELDLLMTDCGATHLVHDAGMAEAATALGRRHRTTVHTIEALLDAAELPPAAHVGRADAPVLLVYTSGTTGRAKGAVHTQANLLANMRIAAQVQQIGERDVIATMLPLFHVGGLCIQTLPALLAGAQVILHSRFVADAAIECFERDRPTLTLQVPATMKALLDHPAWPSADLHSLRAVWAGSSMLPSALMHAFHARGLPVCNVYGATETGPFSIALPPEHARSHVGSCGWPAPGVQVRLQGDGGAAGELLIRGPNVVARYWPDLPACDSDGWFHTGDLALHARDGSYSIEGRARDLIISGGENIHPAEIEAVLAEHAAIAECAAFGLPDETWGEIVAAAIVWRPGCAATEQELRAHLDGRLARYKLPRVWFTVNALPKTALGKLQRQSLVQLVHNSTVR